MLEDSLKEQLQTLFVNLRETVYITPFIDDGPVSEEMLGFLRDVAAQSERVQLQEAQREATGERAPSFALSNAAGDTGIRFAGIPGGHEFSSLVLAILQSGGHPPKVDADTIAQIRGLTGEFHFETFVSLSCHNCPDVVQALNLLAVLNPGVRHTMIDGARFQDEVDRREIMAVPSVFLNGEAFGQGRMELAEILNKIDSSATERAAERLNEMAPFDVLVIGGGPAGVAAAIYCARKGIRTGIVAERIGGQVQDTLAIENLICVRQTEGPKLALDLEANARDYGVEIINLQRVAHVTPASAPGVQAAITLENGAELRAGAVILATGARWREMNVPGEAEYRAKGVAFCPHCDGPLFKGKRVAVIGGGNSGIEAAIDLAGVVEHVTVLEFAPQLRADEVLLQKLASLPNVTVHKNAQTTEVLGDGHKVTGLRYTDRESGQSRQLDLAGIFVQIGLVPNTAWLDGVVERNRMGEIVVNARNETSAAGIFAAGDCTTVPYKQIVIGMGEGAKAALSAFDYLIRTQTERL